MRRRRTVEGQLYPRDYGPGVVNARSWLQNAMLWCRTRRLRIDLITRWFVLKEVDTHRSRARFPWQHRTRAAPPRSAAVPKLLMTWRGTQCFIYKCHWNVTRCLVSLVVPPPFPGQRPAFHIQTHTHTHTHTLQGWYRAHTFIILILPAFESINNKHLFIYERRVAIHVVGYYNWWKIYLSYKILTSDEEKLNKEKNY